VYYAGIVSLKPWAFYSALIIVAFVPSSAAGQTPSHDLEREFQATVAEYNEGKFAEAAAKLETLVREVPESFEAQELLGLVYAAQSQDAKANQHLEKAVRLKPDSAPARSNLAANLVRMGKLNPAQD